MVSAAERREALKAQTRQSHRERGQRGLRTTLHEAILRTFPKDVEWAEIRAGREKNEFDIIPFLITQSWFADLLTFSGKKSEAPRGVGYLSYKFEVPCHRGVGPNNEWWLCLREAFGKPCAMCEDKFAEFDKPKDKQDKDKISSLNASWRCFYNVYDYNVPERDIHPFEISYKLFEEPLLEEIELDEDELLCPWDLEDGRIIEFKGREKKFGQWEFIEPHSFSFHKRDPYDEGVLKDAFSFDKYLYIPTYDEVAAAYYGVENLGEVGGGSDAQPEEQQEPRRARRSRSQDDGQEPKRQRKTREPEQGQEEEQESPSERRSRRRARVSAEDKKEEGGECPVGGKFGYDCNELDECQDCPDEVFDKCVELQDKLKVEEEKKAQEPDPEPKEEKEKPQRRPRRRTK
jgi:hypothetical protein